MVERDKTLDEQNIITGEWHGCHSKNNEKLPYLHKITKRKLLVSNKNMGQCLFISGSKMLLGNTTHPYWKFNTIFADKRYYLGNFVSVFLPTVFLVFSFYAKNCFSLYSCYAVIGNTWYGFSKCYSSYFLHIYFFFIYFF